MSDMTQSVLVLGAASDMARAIAHEYARGGASIILAARDAQRLEADAVDMRLRYSGEVRVAEFDVLETARHASFIDGLGALPDTVICVIGLLGDQDESARVPQTAELVMRTNYTGCCLILGEIANRMEARGSGCIIGVSSVAGDRGRAKNYIYGSAKAGFTAFLSGLRARLAPKGVRVITVQPGFVDTQMTAGMDLPKALTAQPAEVARAIHRAQAHSKHVIYVRPVWRLVMAIIRALPETIFMRTKF
jgi:decaprenylphospho-beta-D-erythro-pentofuranosid-2-ulose 2-reductase